MTSEQYSRLASVAPVALAVAAATGVPAELSLAQAAVESRYLLPSKCAGYNCLGIKYAARHQAKQLWTTHEILTPKQLAGLRKAGKRRILSAAQRSDGRLDVIVEDEFAVFVDWRACFADHAAIIQGQYSDRYRAGWTAYLRDRQLEPLFRSQLLVYATAGYGELAWQIARGPQFQRLLVTARAAAA
jgi:flagellum-specific peptidoglycan hydrolase FlgJ